MKIPTHENSKGHLPRDDYREAANLGLLMLGDAEMDNFNFLRPGACHHARWMAHLLYGPKIYAFGKAMGYDETFMDKLGRLRPFSICYKSDIGLNRSNK